jgi:hypothetical protein
MFHIFLLSSLIISQNPEAVKLEGLQPYFFLGGPTRLKAWELGDLLIFFIVRSYNLHYPETNLGILHSKSIHHP